MRNNWSKLFERAEQANVLDDGRVYILSPVDGWEFWVAPDRLDEFLPLSAELGLEEQFLELVASASDLREFMEMNRSKVAFLPHRLVDAADRISLSDVLRAR